MHTNSGLDPSVQAACTHIFCLDPRTWTEGLADEQGMQALDP